MDSLAHVYTYAARAQCITRSTDWSTRRVALQPIFEDFHLFGHNPTKSDICMMSWQSPSLRQNTASEGLVFAIAACPRLPTFMRSPSCFGVL